MLNRITKIKKYLLLLVLCVDPNQNLPELCLHKTLNTLIVVFYAEVSIFLKTLFDEGLGMLWELN